MAPCAPPPPFPPPLHMQPFRRALEKKSTKTSRSFQRNIWCSSFSFFMAKLQPRPQSNFEKIVFSPSSYSDKMRKERGWSKQLYILFIVQTRNFTERDFKKDLTYSSKVKYIKIYPNIMIKTSRLHHRVNIGDVIAKFENVFVC